MIALVDERVDKQIGYNYPMFLHTEKVQKTDDWMDTT